MERKEYEMMYKEQFIKKKEFELGVCYLDEDYMQESDEYKQVFNCAEVFLKQRNVQEHQEKSYQVFRNFYDIVKRNRDEKIENTWGGFASVFLLLTWYALRIIRAPWRRSYWKIKTYGGHFNHAMYSNFPPSIVDELMNKLGFMYDHQHQTFLFHQQRLTSTGNWKDALSLVGMDFFLVHVRCSLSSTQTGRSLIVQGILESRENDDTIGVSPPPSLKNSTHFYNQSDITARQPGFHLHSSSTKRHGSPMVPKKSPMVKNQGFGSVYHASNLSNKTKRSAAGSLGADKPRLEVKPNFYVPSRLTHKSLETKVSAGNRESPHGIPWEHRYFTTQKQGSSSDYKPNFQGENDELPLDEGRDSFEPSITDALIRYPPNEGYLSTSRAVRDDSLHKAMTTDEHIANATKILKIKPSMDYGSSSKHYPNDNYVRVKPIVRTKILHPPKERIESGYYSEWPSSSRPDTSKYLDDFPYYAGQTGGAHEGVGTSRTMRGEYVHVFPTKRPPGDGRPESRTPLYQEIPEDDRSSIANRSSTSKPKLHKSNQNFSR